MNYPIHKGIDRQATFKGLSLQSLLVLALGFMISFLGYFLLTLAGLSFLVSLVLSIGFFLLLFLGSKGWEKKYGRHGLTKNLVRLKIGYGVIVRSVRGMIKVRQTE